MIIRLDFENRTMFFNNPIKVFLAKKLEEVEACLAEMQQYAKQGYYLAGYLAYESSEAFNSFNKTKDSTNNQLPLLLFGAFENFSTPPESDISFFESPLPLQSNTSKSEYNENIAKIRQEIKKGNTYQINYTIKFNSQFDCNPFEYYRFLQKNSNANYCAYIEFEHFTILSLSPELFFKLENGTLTTKPMKGTAGRGINLEEDKRQLDELFSEKNQAENMMIVDLLRNDLSRISKHGTVNVTKLFEAEKYPTVWQLTSTIQSELKPNINLFQLFQALFPCGSITGAPKASSMKIIAELEKQNREIYCGSIGYIAPFLNKAVFNIPIRTLTIDKNRASYGVGGGITWDSTEQGEYNEILEKTAILSQSVGLPDFLIETLLLKNGNYFLLDEHMSRLKSSADYFDFQLNSNQLKNELLNRAKCHLKNAYKVRIKLDKKGFFIIELDELLNQMVIKSITLAENNTHCRNVYLYHKTSNRLHLPKISVGNEALCYNEKNEITEFVNGNMALLINNKWLTPKLTSGVLPGTMRQHCLNQGEITEHVILLPDIDKVEKIAFINSVRGWIDIENSVLNDLKEQIKQKQLRD